MVDKVHWKARPRWLSGEHGRDDGRWEYKIISYTYQRLFPSSKSSQQLYFCSRMSTVTESKERHTLIGISERSLYNPASHPNQGFPALAQLVRTSLCPYIFNEFLLSILNFTVKRLSLSRKYHISYPFYIFPSRTLTCVSQWFLQKYANELSIWSYALAEDRHRLKADSATRIVCLCPHR